MFLAGAWEQENLNSNWTCKAEGKLVVGILGWRACPVERRAKSHVVEEDFSDESLFCQYLRMVEEEHEITKARNFGWLEAKERVMRRCLAQRRLQGCFCQRCAFF